MYILILLTSLLHADVPAEIQARLAQPIDPGAYTKELQTKKLDLPQEVPGQLYGVVAWQILPYPIARVREQLRKPGGIYEVLQAIKTQRDLVKLTETPTEVEVKLAIIVPVVSDYHTQDKITLDGNRLSWRQSTTDGELAYNQGYTQITAEGESAVRVLVVGVHFIKPESRVPWIGRGAASRFAIRHYGGYVTALGSVLQAPAATARHVLDGLPDTVDFGARGRRGFRDLLARGM